MNSQVLIVLAIVLLLGAGVAGYWGLSLSQPPPSPVPVAALETPTPVAPAAESTPLAEQVAQRVDAENRVDVVVLARDVAAYSVLSEDDLAVERLRLAPPDSYSDPAALLGHSVWRALSAGTVLNSSSFEAGGPLARMIRPDERALAIAIDEVVSGGGHLRPGDYVDALLFLNEDASNADRTMQVAVPALRVLGVGAALGMPLDGEAALPPPDDADSRVQQRQAATAAARSAVLAVPEALLTRFALATQVGQLRLAVRSADEQRLAGYYASEGRVVEELNQQLFQFEKLALSTASRPQPGLVPPPPRGIPVYRGSALSHELP